MVCHWLCFFFFYCSQLQTHSWPAIFLTKDLTKWLHWTLPLSQSAAAVTPESNERPFVIIKWIDQRSLHVQKCNDTANGIVPLLPSRCYNYIVKGHGELTATGRFSTVDCVSNVVQPQYPWKKLRTLSIYNGVIFLFLYFGTCSMKNKNNPSTCLQTEIDGSKWFQACWKVVNEFSDSRLLM